MSVASFLLVVVVLGRGGRLGLAAALRGRRFEGEPPLELVDEAAVDDVDLCRRAIQ